MRVVDRMTPDPSSVRPYHTLAAAKALMRAEGLRHIAVIEDGKLVGILSDRDLRNHSGYLDCTKVNAAMTPGSDHGRAGRQHRAGGALVPHPQGWKPTGRRGREGYRHHNDD